MRGLSQTFKIRNEVSHRYQRRLPQRTDFSGRRGCLLPTLTIYRSLGPASKVAGLPSPTASDKFITSEPRGYQALNYTGVESIPWGCCPRGSLLLFPLEYKTITYSFVGLHILIYFVQSCLILEMGDRYYFYRYRYRVHWSYRYRYRYLAQKIKYILQFTVKVMRFISYNITFDL